MKITSTILLRCGFIVCLATSHEAFSQQVKKIKKTQKNTAGYIMPEVYARSKTPEQLLKDPLGQKIELKEHSVADQVIADDLIVQGSECVGIDCVNNENFGFTTIRMKENNTRIGFDDTSTSAGFAANDWEIEANESPSGGTNSFAINDVTGAKTPFKIIAGAPTSSFYMASTGKIGFRTAAPILDLHINTSDTPAIRLEQNNLSGFTAQTWDMGGNEANFFIRDLTGGSRLPFRIRPGAPTSSIDINASGMVGINTESPQATLHVEGFAYVRDSLFVKGPILPGAVLVPSDAKLKRNISAMGKMSDIISSLNPKTYYYKAEEYSELGFSKNLQYGLIAQELEKVLPTFVSPTAIPGKKESFKTVNYVGLIPILLQGLKEQIEMNKQQKTEIDELKTKLARYETLSARLERLELILSNEEKEIKTDKK
jgi:hypothetical protein